MIKIGNIITFNKSKIELAQFHIFDNLNAINNNLPTLLVGYTETKNLFNGLNFIDRKITDRLFWTTSRLEDRHIFNVDLEKFVEYCEENISSNFNYFFINPFELTLKQTKRLITKLKMHKGVFYQDGPMMYLYLNDFTYGFHKEIGEIYGIKYFRVLKFFSDNHYTEVPTDQIEEAKIILQIIDYDPSKLLFLKEKFTTI